MVRTMGVVLASVVLAVGVLFFGYIGSTISMRKAKAQTAPTRPNIVFILTDDMRNDDLKYMPKTRSHLGTRGMQFDKAFVSNPVCCPSRATIMRGQYTHNTGVSHNNNGPDGGWQGYKNHGNEKDNIATRLRNAGYRTGLFGKYLNGYDRNAVPLGWNDWFAMSPTTYFRYSVNDNGTKKDFGRRASDYSTDVLSREARSFIAASDVVGKPFFAYVAPKAPHEPAVPAPRHVGTFDGVTAPRSPSFNESDMGDKPPWLLSKQVADQTKIAEIDARHEDRVESLQSVDELVEAVVKKLRNVGELDNTYIMFTSDNGWQHGEHRIKFGKYQPYEESIRMPLLVRGPGVQAGTTTNKLALNTDFFPTFTDLTGVRTPDYVDGRSLRPVLERSAATRRTAFLLERRSDDEFPSPSLNGIRTSAGKKYIEYEGGFKEFYDLKTDLYELNNFYDADSGPAALVTRLRALEGCVGATCRSVEDGP